MNDKELKDAIAAWLDDGEPHADAEVMHHVWSMLHGASIYIAALESDLALVAIRAYDKGEG